MARVHIAEFGTIQKSLAGASVTFFVADAAGENTGALATLYQATTGTDQRSNPQVLDTEGKLALTCYVETPVVAQITGLSSLTQRQINRITVDPVEYPCHVTNSGLVGSTGTAIAEAAAVAAAASAASSSSSSQAAANAAAQTLASITGQNLLTGTSTTSLTVTGTGNKTLTTQAGKGWAPGQRLRISSDDGTKINDGRVVSYTDTALVLNVTEVVAGTGAHADWNISVIGEKGASGVGSGDVLASNNGSEFPDKAAVRNNLGLGAAATKNSYFVQEQSAEVSTVLTTTSQILQDDTIPQKTEGVEVVSVTITPTNAASKLIIEGEVHGAHSAGTTILVCALFKDDEANATKIGLTAAADNAYVYTSRVRHVMVAGGIAPITFRLRAGCDRSGTLTVNGASGARRYGGALKSWINVVEVKE